MLLFAAKIYQIAELAVFLKLSIRVDVSLCYYSLIISYSANIILLACIMCCVGKCELHLMVFYLLVLNFMRLLLSGSYGDDYCCCREFLFHLYDNLHCTLQGDPYLYIGDDMQLYLKAQADPRDYGSSMDQDSAQDLLMQLKFIIGESKMAVLNIIARSLSHVTEVFFPDMQFPNWFSFIWLGQ